MWPSLTTADRLEGSNFGSNEDYGDIVHAKREEIVTTSMTRTHFRGQGSPTPKSRGSPVPSTKGMYLSTKGARLC